MKWREPYLARRRACGWGLYGTMGITRDDKAGMHAQRRQNYEFFGAPTALIFTIDRELEKGSWLDTGMFIQSIMIAARQFGLETIPQAALANYHEVLRARLAIPAGEIVDLWHGARLSRHRGQGEHLHHRPRAARELRWLGRQAAAGESIGSR